MKKARPIRNSFISQKFGENRLPIYKESGMLGHNGIDLPCPPGMELRFDVLDCHGFVYQKHTDSSGGLGLDVITEDKDGIFKHRYWHLKDYAVEVGQTVGTGDLLGHCDNTGRSTGSHLHWALKPQRIDDNGNYRNKYPDNGYAGAIDFTYKDIFVKDYMDNLKGQLSILQQIINLIKKYLYDRITFFRRASRLNSRDYGGHKKAGLSYKVYPIVSPCYRVWG